MERPRRVILPWVLLSLLLAGCAAGPVGPGDAPAPTAPEGWPTVVAVLDSGANPYHVSVQGELEDAALAEAVEWKELALSTEGDYDQRVQADLRTWDSLERGQVYRFAGTRLAAVSFRTDTDRLILDQEAHGAKTLSMVARNAPDVLLLMVQVSASACLDAPQSCSIDPTAAEGMRWAAEQPWIDVISVSIALPANQPDPGQVHPEAQAWLDASRLAHESGKLVLNAAGNTVAPGDLSYFNGPPWVICVGGAERTTSGASVVAGQLPDVVANFTAFVARPETVDELAMERGTSMATPVVAGTLAQAIHLARVAAGHRGGTTAGGDLVLGPGAEPIRNADVRAAMNASALIFAPTEWNPTASPTNDTVRDVFAPTAPSLLPFGQMGWGYVDGSLSGAIAERLLARDLAPPAEKSATATFQAQRQAAREQAWSAG